MRTALRTLLALAILAAIGAGYWFTFPYFWSHWGWWAVAGLVLNIVGLIFVAAAWSDGGKADKK